METDQNILEQLAAFNQEDIVATYHVSSSMRPLTHDIERHRKIYSNRVNLLSACPGGSLRSMHFRNIVGDLEGFNFSLPQYTYSDGEPTTFASSIGTHGVPLPSVMLGLLKDSCVVPGRGVQIDGFGNPVNWLVLFTSGNTEELRQIQIIMQGLSNLRGADQSPLKVRVDVILEEDTQKVVNELTTMTDNINGKNAAGKALMKFQLNKIISKILKMKKNGDADETTKV